MNKKINNNKPESSKDDTINDKYDSLSNYIIEQKLIDDITKSSGISNKPSEIQLNEFIKRSKNLNLNALHHILINKIYNYENYKNSTSIKTFIKSLYLIYTLIKNNKDFKELIYDNYSLFLSIRDYYIISNKFVVDVLELILNILNFENNVLETNNLENNSINIVESKRDLLDDIHEDSNSQNKTNESIIDTKKKFDFIKKSKNNKTDFKNEITVNNIFEDDYNIKDKPTSNVVKSDFIDPKLTINSLFCNNEYDFSKNTENKYNNFEEVFYDTKSIQNNNKVEDILELLNNEHSQTNKSNQNDINYNSIINTDVNLSNDNKDKNNINITKEVIQQKINNHYNYLVSEFGYKNKESLYEYAKKIVLNNPLIYNKFNNTNYNTLENNVNLNQNNIILCKNSNNFDSKKVFGDCEKKDTFDFVKDMLQKK